MREGERKGEQTRQRIIAQAAPIFNTRGFAGSSMQDVMEATGLEKGGLYRHFANKEELAAEAFRYALSRAVRLRTEKVDSTHGAVQQLKSIVRRFVEAPSSLPGGCPLMNTAVDADDGNARLRKMAQKGFADWRERLSTIVREGVKRDEIRASTVPRQVANIMIAALEGALLMSRLDGDRKPLDDAQETLEAMLDGIAKKPKQKR